MTNELIDSLITSLEDVRHDVWVEEQGEENEGDSLTVLDKVIETLKKEKLFPPPSQEFTNNYVDVFFTDKSKMMGIVMEQGKIAGVSIIIGATHSVSFLRTRIWFTIKGTPEALERFKRAMHHAIDLWWSK